MAENLFEKYGIKEVADVTLFRIERKKETYESQREIKMSSILKGAIELKTVYPLVGGIGDEEGFNAYVFTKADILKHINYDCDDVQEGTLKVTTSVTEDPENAKMTIQEIVTASNTTIPHSGTLINGDIEVSPVADSLVSPASWTYTAVAKYSYNEDGTTVNSGTHEFTYNEQVLMLFAKNQNLLARSGARYKFENAETVFGNLEFSDEYAIAPASDEKAVVLRLIGKGTEMTYDIDEINEEMANLAETITAKAYNVQYSDYAELVVEDEMGYFDRHLLGSEIVKNATDGTMTVTGFTDADTYADWAETKNGVDSAIANAKMWGTGEHDSINDAIDALKEKKALLDIENENGLKGIEKIHGGYKVTENATKPTIGTEDTYGDYTYSGHAETSKYSLQSVLDTLTKITYASDEIIDDLEVSADDISNRAIYVRVDGDVDMTAGAFLYILKNKNSKRLLSDKDGVFEFEDKKGNKVYYQDKIFAGVETLALVIIGKVGLIFVANRYGIRKTDKIGWVVSRNGYPTNEACKRVVENGLIHNISVTVEDETFDATCTVSKFSIRKITKPVLKYSPVLYLDTLKISTIEQTGEEVYATGGKGNANLVGWDYGKTITLTIEDALYTPASMSLIFGNEGTKFLDGVKDTHRIDRMEKVTAKRSFIVPAGNSNGTPSEGDISAQAVFYDPNTMLPYQDGTPIAEGEVFLKYTRSVAYDNNSIGKTIEVSADSFPGTYKVVGETFSRSKTTGEDERFMFVIPQAKMGIEQTITLEADGDPTVFDFTLTVLRPDDGIMMKLIQFDIVENTEENDGSTMVKDTENLNLLDDAEMFKVNADAEDETTFIGATEY